MKLIFLDIDGVLNTHEPLTEGVMCGKLHASKVERLNLLLVETGAQIVLTSAWRYLVHRGEMNLAGLGWLLRSHGLRDELVGITRPDTIERPALDGKTPWVPCANERGQQVSDYLATCVGMLGFACKRYVVIDDLDLGITAAGHPLVLCNPKRGFTWADYDNALAALGSLPECDN